MAGRTVSAPGDAVNVTKRRQFWGEVIEHVRRVPGTRQQHHRPSGSAPIKYFQSHRIIDGYELHAVLGRIVPGPGFLRPRNGAGCTNQSEKATQIFPRASCFDHPEFSADQRHQCNQS